MQIHDLKLHDEIYIGNVRVQIVSIKPGQTRIGFEAPDEVEIWREEIAPPRREAPK